MKLQSLTVIFIIIIIPVILIVSLYISTGLKTIKLQSEYDSGLLDATHDAIYAFELNTSADEYANNPEIKRDILKASVKMFEKSLCNTCNISSYNKNEIEKYIPAIVFGMYDGFYVYAPSKTLEGKYEHSLKNYVYYSETLDDGTVIRYSLDNYISVSGYFKENPDAPSSNKYITKEGYLTTLAHTDPGGAKYNKLDINDPDARNYYRDAFNFTYWIDNQDGIPDYLKTENEKNDPEDPNSAFAQHRNQVIKNKIESVLNSSITAYSERTWGQTYKMPKLSEEDWQKIYSNISMITFFQGKSIGLTKYNGYCVLNSTNHNEYVNPNLMYFIDGTDDTSHYYHDIRCTEIANVDKAEDLKGYKIGDFQKIKLSKALNADGSPKILEGKQIYDDNGRETTSAYKYNHNALACYDCINGSLSASTSVYDYVKPNGGTASNEIKTAYWNSLARERYNTIKLLKENGSVEGKEYEEYDYIELNNIGSYFFVEGTIKEESNLEYKIRIDQETYSNILCNTSSNVSNNPNGAFWFRLEYKKICARWGDNYNEYITTDIINKEIILKKTGRNIKGEEKEINVPVQSDYSFVETNKIYLGRFIGRIYYLKIYDATGNPSNELIPVKKKNDGKSYLYDKVRNQYYSCDGAEAKNINEA